MPAMYTLQLPIDLLPNDAANHCHATKLSTGVDSDHENFSEEHIRPCSRRGTIDHSGRSNPFVLAQSRCKGLVVQQLECDQALD